MIIKYELIDWESSKNFLTSEAMHKESDENPREYIPKPKNYPVFNIES